MHGAVCLRGSRTPDAMAEGLEPSLSELESLASWPKLDLFHLTPRPSLVTEGTSLDDALEARR